MSREAHPTVGLPSHKTDRRPRVQVESLVIATFGVFGFRSGVRAVSDNSSFIHLRTGIDMVRTWSIPRADPYSFTAPGHPWVVQSWFASFLYGISYRLGRLLLGPQGGLHGFLLLQALLMAALGLMVASLARTGVAIRTMATGSVAVLFGAIYWSPRPLIFGLLGLAALITVIERRLHPLWLLPVAWVWVNTHGSFPLGIVWLGAYVVGRFIDSRKIEKEMLIYLGVLVGGVLAGGLNPLGPRLLTFPLAVRDKASVFQNVVEWHSPNFQTTDGLIVLGLLAVAIVIVSRHRLPWQDVFPFAGFLALALLSLRNIAPAAVVFAPVLGRAMAPAAGGVLVPEQIAQPDGVRNALNKIFVVALAGLVGVFAVTSLRGDGLDVSTYPAQAQAWMDTHGLLDPTQHRVAEQDVVGCYLILLRGKRARVFIDDRVDMYPVAVSNDYDALLHGRSDAEAILDKYHVDTVLWDKHLPLPDLLVAGMTWTRPYEDRRWVVLTRTA